jgi:diguanylate cyclase (GGDEF)-like protein
MALRRRRSRPHDSFVVLVVHLDQFAKWRESLGTEFRERALLDVGKRIETMLSPIDSLCLWTDSEFAILHESAEANEDSVAVAVEIQQALRRPVVDGNNEMFLTASIGVVTKPTGNESADELVSLASTAAARARNVGVGRIETIEIESVSKPARSMRANGQA